MSRSRTPGRGRPAPARVRPMETAPPAQVVSDPDTGLMTDERLVTLVRQSGLQPARDELLARTAQQRAKLLRRLARDAGLSEADWSDVQQEAVLWTLEAIQHYDHESAYPGGCSFRSFLHRVVTCRFIDFLRHRLRYQRQFIHIGVTSPDRSRRFHLMVQTRARLTRKCPSNSRKFEESELSDSSCSTGPTRRAGPKALGVVGRGGDGPGNLGCSPHLLRRGEATAAQAATPASEVAGGQRAMTAPRTDPAECR